jgi:hypothetical protein
MVRHAENSILKRLRNFISGMTMESSNETRLERVARSIPWRQIAGFADQHTPVGYQQALAFWTLSRCHGILGVFRGVPQLQAYLSRTNQDVVMFETSAFLLGAAIWVLEQQIDQMEAEKDDENEEEKEEDSRDQVSTSAMLVGAMFEEFSGFEAAEDLLVMRTTRYYCAVTKSVEKFCVALAACDGQKRPTQKAVDAAWPDTGLERDVALSVTGMEVAAKLLEPYLKVALALARGAHPSPE